MNRNAALFWDFDGTLASSPGMWSSALLKALKRHAPGCALTLEDIRPFLRDRCFPWHTPQEDFSRITGERWWAYMASRFEQALMGLHVPPEISRKAALDVREIATRPENYTLYPDTLSTLRRFAGLGVRQYVVSNNHPGLNLVAEALGLAAFFDGYLVSGELGYDKPRREILDQALQMAGNPRRVMMIGDNPIADGEGARNAGIPAVLVHRQAEGFPCFETLSQAADFMEEALCAHPCDDP